MTNEEFVRKQDLQETLCLLMGVLEHVDCLLDEPCDEVSDSLDMEALAGWEEAYWLMRDMARDTLAPLAVAKMVSEWEEDKPKEDAE